MLGAAIYLKKKVEGKKEGREGRKKGRKKRLGKRKKRNARELAEVATKPTSIEKIQAKAPGAEP